MNRQVLVYKKGRQKKAPDFTPRLQLLALSLLCLCVSPKRKKSSAAEYLFCGFDFIKASFKIENLRWRLEAALP